MPLFYLFSLIFTLLPFLVIGFIVLIIFQATSQSRKKVKAPPKPSSLLEKYQADWVKNAQKQERPKANPRRSPQARLDQDPKASRKKRRQKEKQAKRKAKQSSKRQINQQATEKNGPDKGLRLRTKPRATARKQNLIQTGLVKLIPARATRSIKERFSQYLINSRMIIDKT